MPKSKKPDRPYARKDRKKGAERRKAEWNQRKDIRLDFPGLEVPEVPRGRRKQSKPEPARRAKAMPSGRGISGGQIFLSGKKAVGANELSGGRAKPQRRPTQQTQPERAPTRATAGKRRAA